MVPVTTISPLMVHPMATVGRLQCRCSPLPCYLEPLHPQAAAPEQRPRMGLNARRSVVLVHEIEPLKVPKFHSSTGGTWEAGQCSIVGVQTTKGNQRQRFRSGKLNGSS